MIEYLRTAHGLFNAIVAVLFFYQGWLGLAIRRARRSQASIPIAAVRRHRKTGPVLASLGGLGFLFGLILAAIDTGSILFYPLHLFIGLTIVLFLIGTFLISRRIKRPDSPYRTPHFILGVCILLLYVFQSFLGIGILF
jgi:Protein of unknown function (DUF4079)